MIGLPFGIIRGQAGLVISYQGPTNFSSGVPNGPASATMEIDSDGTINQLGTSPSPNKASYAQNTNPPFDAADYDFRMDGVGGSLAGGSSVIDAWIPGATVGIQAAWRTSVGGADIQAFGGTFRVRPSGGGGDLITQSITIQADGTP